MNNLNINDDEYKLLKENHESIISRLEYITEHGIPTEFWEEHFKEEEVIEENITFNYKEVTRKEPPTLPEDAQFYDYEEDDNDGF